MKRYAIGFFCVFTLFLPVTLQAQLLPGEETIYSASKYVLQENDTEKVASGIAFIQAKHRMLEKVKVYLKSGRQPERSFSDNDFTTFAPAILGIRKINEEVTLAEDTVTVTVSLKAVVNRRDYFSVMNRLKEDEHLMKKVAEQQREILSTEESILSLQQKVKLASGDAVIALLRERDRLLTKLDSLKKRAITRDAAGKTAEKLLRENFQFD